MTTHSLADKGKQRLPPDEYKQIMNLEKYLNNEKDEFDRRTELRKRTTMLYDKYKNVKELCIDDFHLMKVLGKGAFGNMPK